ncbi:MAG TPA: alpha/beta hydrolase [Noviherbaspirillum sp.]|nr:alpha/beta hydrolase [Noviherbaspirillum sp.]
MSKTKNGQSVSFSRLRDGRTLAFQQYGSPQGRPLYFFHGFPGCRLQASLLDGMAHAADIQLVAMDRPGFGQSTFTPSKTLLSWSDDVEQLADMLGHARFGILGVSCGGAYALACAKRIPARLSYVGLLAGIGPMDIPSIRKEQLPALRAMFTLARISPALTAPMLMLDYVLFRTNPERAVATLSRLLTEPDRQLISTHPEIAAVFGTSLVEAYRRGIRGAMHEAHLIASPRGFSLEDISIPVHLYQSGVDRNVPPAMGRHMAERIRGSVFRSYPDEGHLSVVVNAFNDCAEDFLNSDSL